jgi:hypothetical protein
LVPATPFAVTVVVTFVQIGFASAVAEVIETGTHPPIVNIIDPELYTFPPVVPETVNVYVPAATELRTVNVNVVEPVALGAKVIEGGEKPKLTPNGKPEALNVEVKVFPALSLEILKSYVTVPPTPVMIVLFCVGVLKVTELPSVKRVVAFRPVVNPNASN